MNLEEMKSKFEGNRDDAHIPRLNRQTPSASSSSESATVLVVGGASGSIRLGSDMDTPERHLALSDRHVSGTMRP